MAAWRRLLVMVICAFWGISGTLVSAQTVTDLESGEGITPEDVANSLIGGGVTISNVTYTGAARGLGTFTGGEASIGFEAGIVLSSGKVQTREGDVDCGVGVEGPNTCFETAPIGISAVTTEFGTAGDVDLDALSGFPTLDAAVLEFDFVPRFSTVQFRYVFGSEEYNDFVNSQFNDVFAFFVNGVNCALVPETNQPVSINTINNGNPAGDLTATNPELFRDNVRPAPSIDSQLDGLTTTLTCDALVEPGVVNHMKLAIADASDRFLDSAVFIEGGSFVSGTAIRTELTDGEQSGTMIEVPAGTAVMDTASLMGVNSDLATGFVTYAVFSDAGCSTLFADAGTVPVDGSVVPPSDPVVFDEPGTYYWVASYSGDDVNNPSEAECGSEIVTVTPPPSTGNCKLAYSGFVYPGYKKLAKAHGFAIGRDGETFGKQAFHLFAKRHGFSMKAIGSPALSCSDGAATLEGVAWVKYKKVPYRIDLVDGGFWTGKDTYRLRLGSSFDSGERRLFWGGVWVKPLAAVEPAP